MSAIPCDGLHRLEIVHVGTFSGEHADRLDPPAEDSPGGRAAYAECVAKAADVLGGDFRTGRVWVDVATPSVPAWRAGVHWFRCDAWQYAAENTRWQAETRQGSLRGALAADGVLRFGCYAVTGAGKENSLDLKPAACNQPHNGEFAGTHIARDVPWPADDKQRWDVLGRGCYGVIAKYAGLPDDAKLPFRISFVYWWYGKEEWALGNRAVRCFLRLDRNVTKVMKGAGPAAFPVR